MTVTTMLEAILPEVSIDNMSPTVSDGGFEMRQILAFMNAAGRDINRRAEWSEVIKSFTVSAQLAEFVLPSDFQEMTEMGSVRVNITNGTAIKKVVAPEAWDFLSQNPSAQNYYHLRDGKILFSPVLPAGGAIISYVSKNWVSGGKAILELDEDTSLIPEHLIERNTIARFRRQKGMPYEDYLAEYEADLNTAILANRGIS